MAETVGKLNAVGAVEAGGGGGCLVVDVAGSQLAALFISAMRAASPQHGTAEIPVQNDSAFQ